MAQRGGAQKKAGTDPPSKFQAKDLSPAKNLIVSPPVTFTYLVAGAITMVRVAADTGAPCAWPISSLSTPSGGKRRPSRQY